MATKKDLVEAHSFSRRRLVTAFLSGAPGGREVEPSRPGRTIVGGVALSILLVAGAAIASVLAARTPEDWNKEGLILSREDAALYVILKQEDPPVLHPVINATSAQLIFGADAEATIVSRETVNQQTPGEPIGIFGAPQTLPTTADLIQTGWTACTGDGLGLKVDVARDPSVTLTAPSDPTSAAARGGEPVPAFVVRTAGDGAYYLVATGRVDEDGQRARSYRIPDSSLDRGLSEVGLPSTSEALEVPDEWINLVEPGGDLTWDSFGIEDPGGPLPAELAQALGDQQARIGDYIPPEQGSDETAKVLTANGPVELDPFAAAIYADTTVPGTDGGTPRPLVPGTDLPNVGFASPIYRDANWPDTLLTQPPTAPCVMLTPTPGERPSVQLATDPQGEASAADVADPTDREVRVQPGGGAFVYSGSFLDSSSDTPVVIDARGDYYAIVGDETVGRLGYGGVDPTAVPDTWTRLFTRGVPLSTTAALCPPDPTGEAGDVSCASQDDDVAGSGDAGAAEGDDPS